MNEKLIELSVPLTKSYLHGGIEESIPILIFSVFSTISTMCFPMNEVLRKIIERIIHYISNIKQTEKQPYNNDEMKKTNEHHINKP